MFNNSSVQSLNVLKKDDGATKIGRSGSTVDSDLTDIETTTKAPFIARYYDQISLKEFSGGGVNQGSGVNMTTALNLAIADLSATRFKLLMENGEYYFNSLPNDITAHMQILGAGRGKTFLYKNWASAADDDGIFNFRDGSTNSRVTGLTAYATSASQSGGFGTGCIVSAVPTVSGSVDGLQLRDLWLSSQAPATQAYTHSNIHFNGEARNGAPIGIRDTIIENCALFGCEDSALILRGVVACSVHGGGSFPAGGKSGRLYISGSSSVNSYYVDVNMHTFDGAYLTECRFVNLKGYSTGDITNNNTAQYCFFIGECSGAIQKFWVNSRALLSNDFGLSAKESILGGVAIAASTAYTQAHSLGAQPELIKARLRCTTADLGYTIGEEVDISGNSGITFASDSSSVKYTTDASISLVNRSTGVAGNINFSNWLIEVDVYK